MPTISHREVASNTMNATGRPRESRGPTPAPAAARQGGTAAAAAALVKREGSRGRGRPR